MLQVPVVLQREMMPAVFTNPTEFTIQVGDPKVLAVVLGGIRTAYGAIFIGQRTCVDVPYIKFFCGSWAFNVRSDFFGFRFPANKIIFGLER